MQKTLPFVDVFVKFVMMTDKAYVTVRLVLTTTSLELIDDPYDDWGGGFGSRTYQNVRRTYGRSLYMIEKNYPKYVHDAIRDMISSFYIKESHRQQLRKELRVGKDEEWISLDVIIDDHESICILTEDFS
jgi:hypothetical protein